VFLHELKDVAARTAGKALVDAERRVYCHGGGVVVVKGAYAHEAVCAGAFQRQELLNHKRNVRLRFQLLNDIFRVKGHAPKIVFFV
jgi:hypothetical protein